MSTSAGSPGAGTAAPDTEATVLRLARAMLRTALWPTLVVAAIAVIVAAVLSGVQGAVGALLGTLLVIGCFWLNIAVMRWTAAAQPMVVMGAAIGGYCAKFVVLLALLILLGDTTLFDVDAFGLAILAAVSVWAPAEVIGFVRAKVPTVTPAGGD